MDSLYSIEEIPNALLTPTFFDVDELGSELHRTLSEWDLLQQFLNDDDNKKDEDTEGGLEKENGTTSSLNGCLESRSNGNVPVYVDEYDPAYLKKKLFLACDAVAKTWPSASFVKAQDSAVGAKSGSQGSDTPQSGSKATSKGAGDKDSCAPVGSPSLLDGQKKSGAQLRSSTSGPSRETLDKEVSEGENRTIDPANAKRAMRMLANRESARRVRRKKEAQLTELETKVAELRLKKATFVRRLTDITQKYEKASVDNRVLAADVKALEAEVKMKEAEVIRVTTGFRPALHGISTMSMSSSNGSPSYTSTDAAAPMRGGLNQPLYSGCCRQFYNPHMT